MEEALRIKGMVCGRCISTVKEIFIEQGFTVTKIGLGEVTYQPQHSEASLQKVTQALTEEGFEVLTDKQSRIIAKVKELVEEHLSGPEHSQHNFSEMVTESLYMDYDSVGALFTATEGSTLERYLILRRLEKAKELLQHPHLSLTDIAFRLNYSSVHHFSNQFKKETGLSPSYFREIQSKGQNQVSS